MHLGSFGPTAVRAEGWVKATASAGGACCVTIKAVSERMLVMGDSKTRLQPGYVAHFEPVVALSSAGYERLRVELARRDTGQSGVIVSHPEASVERLGDGTMVVTSTIDRTALKFLPEEWDAYLDGIRGNELRLVDLVDASV